MEQQDAKYIFNIQNGEHFDIGDRSQAFHKGLMTLTTLLSDEKIYNQVLVCRTDSQKISKQIDNIKIYKDIHDLLHRLEFNCYRGIALEAKDSWLYLKAKIINKCISSQANLVNPIREYEKDLECELFLENPNINKLNYHSRNYRRIISDHLYNITNNVQALFNELQKVDDSLSLIINMTLHDGI